MSGGFIGVHTSHGIGAGASRYSNCRNWTAGRLHRMSADTFIPCSKRMSLGSETLVIVRCFVVAVSNT
jgi:hypothetical protein